MTDDKRGVDNKSARSWAIAAAWLGGGMGLVYLGNHLQQMTRLHQDWYYLAIGTFLATLGMADLRRGSSLMAYRWVTRSDNPVRYWLAVVLEVVVGGGLIVIALGELFGVSVIAKFANWVA